MVVFRGRKRLIAYLIRKSDSSSLIAHFRQRYWGNQFLWFTACVENTLEVQVCKRPLVLSAVARSAYYCYHGHLHLLAGIICAIASTCLQASFLEDPVDRWIALIDNFIGGSERTAPSVFSLPVLRDLGMMLLTEPFKNLMTQGMVKSFVRITLYLKLCHWALRCEDHDASCHSLCCSTEGFYLGEGRYRCKPLYPSAHGVWLGSLARWYTVLMFLLLDEVSWACASPTQWESAAPPVWRGPV